MLIDIFTHYHNATYVCKLTKIILEEINPKYIVQDVIDVGTNFKKVDELIQDDYSHIFLYTALNQPNDEGHCL